MANLAPSTCYQKVAIVILGQANSASLSFRVTVFSSLNPFVYLGPRARWSDQLGGALAMVVRIWTLEIVMVGIKHGS